MSGLLDESDVIRRYNGQYYWHEKLRGRIIAWWMRLIRPVGLWLNALFSKYGA